MKKSLSFFISILVCAVGLSAEESLFGFTIEPVYGLRNGILTEYVYEKNSKTKEEYYLSLLDWDIKNTSYIGSDFDLRIQKFHLKAGLKTFFENENGFMEDSDWLQDASYKTGNTDVKTNFSKHTAHLMSGFNFDIEARYEFYPFDFWAISPTVGFSYQEYSLMGKNGTSWYGHKQNTTDNYDQYYYSYTDSQHRNITNFSGNVIKLEHADYYVWTGISTLFKTPDEHWNFYLDFSFSPYTYMLVRDSHYLNNGNTGTYYIDISEGFFSAFKASAYVQYKFNRMVGLKFLLSGLLTTELHGIEYVSNKYESGYKKNSAVIGAASKYFDVQISASCSF